MILILFYVQALFALKLELFVESQCPDTHRLIKKLKDLVDQQKLLDQIELEFIIFGKGTQELVQNRWKFECQHASLECSANLLEICVTHQLDWIDQLKFITCLHSVSMTNMDQYHYSAKKCLQDYPCVFERAKGCVDSKFGLYLQHKAADKTLAEQITRVPWVKVDGVHDASVQAQIERDFMGWLCKQINC